MAERRASWIHFDKISGVTSIFQDKVQTEESGQAQSTRHPFRALDHFRIVDDTYNAGGTGRVLCTEYFDADASKHFSFPANDRAICGPTANVFLDDYLRPIAIPPAP